jgi:hypothetical protein
VERLAEGGHVHDAGEQAVAVQGGDRNGVARQPVEEVGRAVDGVDEPLDPARARAVGTLLADDGVVGPRREQTLDDERLRAAVELGHHVGGGRLGGDVVQTTLAAIARERAGLDGETAGERDQLGGGGHGRRG